MTSLITIGIVFICLAIILRVLDKHRRGIPLSRAEKYASWIALTITIVWGVLSIAEMIGANIAILSAISPQAGWVILGFLVLVTAILARHVLGKPKAGGIAILEILKPELTGMRPLNIASLPAEGWIGVKVVSDIEHKGCLGRVKTDVDESPLFDWEEYRRNPDTRNGADPYKSFNLLEHETKRLYTQIKTGTTRVTVILDIGKETIQKELPLQILDSKKPTTEILPKPLDEKQESFPWICEKMAADDDLRSFDEEFRAVQQESEPKTKARVLDYFQPELRNLCYNYKWDDVKERIEKVLEYLPNQLSNSPHVLDYLQYIGMIINRFAEHTRDKIGEKWLDELEKLYDDPRYETNSNILNILQELVQYDAYYLRKLIDDSSTQWSDQRFQVLVNQIGFLELKKGNEKAYEGILRYLRQKMGDAERNKEEKAHERLDLLYTIAKRYR